LRGFVEFLGTLPKNPESELVEKMESMQVFLKDSVILAEQLTLGTKTLHVLSGCSIDKHEKGDSFSPCRKMQLLNTMYYIDCRKALK
jgi:hypothetical protein